MEFVKKSQQEIDKMSAAELGQYYADLAEHKASVKDSEINSKLKELKESGAGNAEAIEKLEARIEKSVKDLEDHAVRMKSLSEKARRTTDSVDEMTVKGQIMAKEESYKSFVKNGGSFAMEIKAQQDAADITSGTDFAQMLSGVGQIATRRPFLKDLFRTVRTNTEYIKYNDQETIVRDAKNVAGCAASTHTSKITWQVRTLQQKKVRDYVDACIDMLEDYDWTQAEIENLVMVDVALKVDEGLLLGDGTGANINGIASYASTFAAGSYATSVQAATVVDLLCVAGAQIADAGQNNKFMANVVLMNPVDAKLMRLEKDANNNYLIPNWVTSNGVQIDGMRVIENPLVPANEAYVMDSTKGVIYQSKESSVEMAFENGTNFEQELVTVKAYERLNLLVRNVDANAFMHIPDIGAAVTAITAP